LCLGVKLAPTRVLKPGATIAKSHLGTNSCLRASWRLINSPQRPVLDTKLCSRTGNISL
jgi:hypothetical protein